LQTFGFSLQVPRLREQRSYSLFFEDKTIVESSLS